MDTARDYLPHISREGEGQEEEKAATTVIGGKERERRRFTFQFTCSHAG